MLIVAQLDRLAKEGDTRYEKIEVTKNVKIKKQTSESLSTTKTHRVHKTSQELMAAQQ